MAVLTDKTLQLFGGFMQVNLERGLLVAQRLLDDIRNQLPRPMRMSSTLSDAFRTCSMVLDAFKLHQRAEKYGTRRLMQPEVASQLQDTLVQFAAVVRELRLEGDPDVNELYTRLMQRMQHKLAPATPKPKPEPEPEPEQPEQPQGEMPKLPSMPPMPGVDAGYEKVSRTNGEHAAAKEQASIEQTLPPVKANHPKGTIQSGRFAGMSPADLMKGVRDVERTMKELQEKFWPSKPPPA